MMKTSLKIGLSMGIFLMCIPSLSQQSYFVHQNNGSDTNSGTTPSMPYQSVAKALQQLSPGDTLFIMGSYKNKSYATNYQYQSSTDSQLWHAENTIKINNLHGTPTQKIHIRSFDKNAILHGDGANILRISNASYLQIEGLTIRGEVTSIPLTTANKLQFVYLDADKVGDVKHPKLNELKFRNEECIQNCTPNQVVDGEIYSDISSLTIVRPSYIDTRGLYLSQAHHITLIGNTISHMPGGGLRVAECEDIHIENNEISHCSKRSYSGTHGLVVTKTVSSRTDSDYRIKILRNTVHHNYNEQYSWAPSKRIITPHIDEGKGISLQRNETTYQANGDIKINWEHGRILVANNIAYFNGFSGIHSNDGNRIDIVNNTAYFNSYTKSITENLSSSPNGGNIGISAVGGRDIKLINNIVIIDKNLSKSALASNLTSNHKLVVKNNLIFGSDLQGNTGTIDEDASIVALQEESIMADPLFTNPSTGNFELQKNSPAINAASTVEAPKVDYYNKLRSDNAPDIGAVEYFSTLAAFDVQNTTPFFPNPVEKSLFFDARIKIPRGTLLFNMQGQDLTHRIQIHEHSIDFSYLPTGCYILVINNKAYKIFKRTSN